MEYDPILQELQQSEKLLPAREKDDYCRTSEALTDEVFILPDLQLDHLDSLTLSPDVMMLASEVLPSVSIQIPSSSIRQMSSSDYSTEATAADDAVETFQEQAADYFPTESLNSGLLLDEYSLLKAKMQCQEPKDSGQNLECDGNQVSAKKHAATLSSLENELDENVNDSGTSKIQIGTKAKEKKKKSTAKRKSAYIQKSEAGVMTVVAISRNKTSNITQIVINTGNKEEMYNGETLELIQSNRNLPKLSKVDNCQNNRHEMIITGALEDLGITERDLQGSLSEHGKVWLCPQDDCARRFTKLYGLKCHLLGHFGIRPFKCDHEGCAWAFYSEFKLKRHKETHLKRKDYACKIPGCKRRFTTVYNLWSHEKLHSRPSRIVCQVPECQERFQTKRSLELHMKSHDQSHAPYVCNHDGCDKRYYSSNALTSHQRCHSYKESDIKCSWPGCDKVFDKPCRLKAHMRSHTGCKPYLCTFQDCQWAFTSSSKLKRHQKKHTNERKFVCEICLRRFMRSDHLQDHRLTHKEGRCFQCHLCDAKFSAKSSLYVHIKKQHRENTAADLDKDSPAIEELSDSERTKEASSYVINVHASSFPPVEKKLWHKDDADYIFCTSSTSSMISYETALTGTLSKSKSSFSDGNDDMIVDGYSLDSDALLKPELCSSLISDNDQGSARTGLTRSDVWKLKVKSPSLDPSTDPIVTDVILGSSDIGESLFLTEDLSSSMYYQDEIGGTECQVLLLDSVPTENISLRDLE